MYCGWTLLGARVAAQVAALKPINVPLCLCDVSAQSGCFQPFRACSAAGGDIPAVYPNQLMGQLAQLVAQCADQFGSLGCIAVTHTGIVASHCPSRSRTR
jgi:hypothetical protein